ncbi:MAG: SDR family oxidoreductase [Pirellulaceae bacterium]|nr:SDR family oxidoreductase [Pirellulaceae bacterium]
MFFPKRHLAKKRILLTGASSGIGRALARQLAQNGARLLITARREERLKELQTELQRLGAECHYYAGDITDSKTRSHLIEQMEQQFGGIDILINNAGMGKINAFEKTSSETLRQQMEVNFFAAVELIRQALPYLKTGVQPIIVNISSVLGHCAVPFKSEYCASKFALHGFTDALRAELSNDSIEVILVSPSTTESEFFEKAATEENQKPGNQMMMSPEIVAIKTISAIRKGKRELILSFGGKFLVLFDRLFPGTSNYILSKIFRAKQSPQTTK